MGPAIRTATIRCIQNGLKNSVGIRCVRAGQYVPNNPRWQTDGATKQADRPTSASILCQQHVPSARTGRGHRQPDRTEMQVHPRDQMHNQINSRAGRGVYHSGVTKSRQDKNVPDRGISCHRGPPAFTFSNRCCPSRQSPSRSVTKRSSTTRFKSTGPTTRTWIRRDNSVPQSINSQQSQPVDISDKAELD